MAVRSPRGLEERVRTFNASLDDFNWSWKKASIDEWRIGLHDWYALRLQAVEIPWDVVCRSWTDYCPFPKEHGTEPPKSWRMGT